MNVKNEDLSVTTDELAALDDAALLSWRAKARAELERLAPRSPGHAALTALYDKTTGEVNARASEAWARAS